MISAGATGEDGVRESRGAAAQATYVATPDSEPAGGRTMRYRFGDYVFDTRRHELHHAGEPIKLRRKVFEVLAYLLVHRERVVTKQELLEHLWPDQFVGDEALTSCIDHVVERLA